MSRMLKTLHHLDLSYNKLKVVGRKTLKGTPLLKNLQLDNNEITCISEHALKPLKDMEILTLNKNNLTTLPPNVFEDMEKLRVVKQKPDAISNLCQSPAIRGINSIITMCRIADNELICDCHLSWLARWLMAHPTLALFTKCKYPEHLKNAEIAELRDEDFTCTGLEQVTHQQECSMPPLCPSPCLCTDNIVDCRNKGLTDIPENIPDTTLEMRFEMNQITEIKSQKFAEFKRLRRIDLSNNQISRIAPDAFAGLKSLNSLVLYGNKIIDLPPGVFKGLTSLQLLLLNANKITCVRVDTFEDLYNLNLLSLYDNQIQSLANGTFVPLKNIQTLHLARNPFICDCNLQWLAEYLHFHPIETSGARCESPNRMKRKKLGLINEEKFTCKGSEVYRTRNAAECIIDSECPEDCDCEGTVVLCSGRGLTAMPKEIPSYTTELLLSDNAITTVEKSGLYKKLTNLKRIDLRNNKISLIEDEAFTGAINLQELILTENEMRSLSTGTFKGLDNLQTLMLRSNKIRCINNVTFAHLENLQLLSLYDNQIRCVQPGAFDHLTKLSTLNLLNNPFVCNCHLSWLNRWLKEHNLITGNPRCAEPKWFKDTPIEDLESTDFVCESPSDAGCHPGTPICCSPNGLDTEQKSCDPRAYCPPQCKCDGTVVRCSYEKMTDLPPNIALDTTELDLSNNKLLSLPEYAFANLTELNTLILSYNKLQCVQEKTFAGLKNLKILSLHGNDLSSIPYGSFKELVSLTHLGLGDNPLYCDCSLKWLSDWIKMGYKEPGIAACVGPPNMHNKLLLTTPSNLFQCYEKGDINILAKCNICYTYPCQHGGTCHLLGFKKYRCECPAGYHGDRCEEKIDACFGNPCDNNGKCQVIDTFGRFSCTCLAGFEGDRCETNIDDCQGHKCQNNATCVDEVQSYTCSCKQGFTGEFCERKISFCEDVNPCHNGAQCIGQDLDFRCNCPTGFTGKDCSINIDDCHGVFCQNGATCEDGVNSYVCVCQKGYKGKHCEIAPVAMEYPQTSVCQHHDCKNGGLCFQPAGSPEYVCRCPPGFDGKKCEKLSTISLHDPDAYAELNGLNYEPHLNLTFVLSTHSKEGILFYHGFDKHVAIEIFRSRIRVSFDIGNYPVSTMFSYEQINDNKTHVIHFMIVGKNMSMRIDKGMIRTIRNEGEKTWMSLDEHYFIGGLPPEVSAGALKKWHLRNTKSLSGCLHKIYINERPVDFTDAVKQYKVTPGCFQVQREERVIDLCYKHRCKIGKCRPLKDGSGYKCRCKRGYTGKYCDTVRVNIAKFTAEGRHVRGWNTPSITLIRRRGVVQRNASYTGVVLALAEATTAVSQNASKRGTSAWFVPMVGGTLPICRSSGSVAVQKAVPLSARKPPIGFSRRVLGAANYWFYAVLLNTGHGPLLIRVSTISLTPDT
ncbi:hypothetical protein LSH36_74g12006 [Paralvinella palmiformis]|uniref:Uncharacterized protein n=1 Tax=Paralvinella palmiformis TaxID=53620 RepID=A0AAD9K2L9_9ANNE|nr:hypothetical protein LSH36_74g12006 [Paralvinella palmiformis]